MRRVTAGTFQMAALPWTGKREFLDRELGINLTEFRADMLDWRNNKWKDSPSRPASNWRQYLLYYQYGAAADSAQGTEWQLHRTIPTLEFLRYDGGICTLDKCGKIHLNDGTGSSGAKTIGYNPWNLINHSMLPIGGGILIDNVQDALDALAGAVSRLGGGLRNIMDVDKDELNNMALRGTVATAAWRSPGRQELASTFHNPWLPRNSAIFGDEHDIFRGENLLVYGKGNVIGNNAFTETACSLIAGLENKVLCRKESATEGLAYNLTNSILAGQHNETMNAVSASVICGYENRVGDWALEEEEEEEEEEGEEDDGEEGESLGVSGLLVAGGRHRVFNARHSIVAGYGNLLAGGSDCSAIFGQGSKAIDGSVGLLVAGEGNLAAGTGLSVIGGTGNKLTDGSWHSAIFGAGNGIHNYSVQSFIAGSGNMITDGSVHSAIFGAGNGIHNCSVQSFIAGSGNGITGGSVSSAIFGAGNKIANFSAMSFIAGAGNDINSGSAHSAIFGTGNQITNASVMSFIAGAGNAIAEGSAHSAAFGAGNRISGRSVQSFIAGNANAMSGSDNSAAFGRDCIASHSKQSFMAGLGNRISDSDLSFAGGLCNRISGGSVQSAAFGEGNAVYRSPASFAAGTGNIIADRSAHSAVLGSANGIYDGSAASFIAGTGSRITGGSVFSAIFGAGNGIHNQSTQSFIAGTGNLIATGSVHSAIFGAGNKITEASSQSFIAGGGNLATQSEAAAIFGRDNKIAGYSDYSFIGGYRNSIDNNSGYSSILGGSGNSIDGYSYHSAILGGSGNAIINARHAAILGGHGLRPVADCFAVADRLAINSRLLLLGDGAGDPPGEGDVLMVEGLENLAAADGGTVAVPRVKWGGASGGMGLGLYHNQSIDGALGTGDDRRAGAFAWDAFAAGMPRNPDGGGDAVNTPNYIQNSAIVVKNGANNLTALLQCVNGEAWLGVHNDGTVNNDGTPRHSWEEKDFRRIATEDDVASALMSVEERIPGTWAEPFSPSNLASTQYSTTRVGLFSMIGSMDGGSHVAMGGYIRFNSACTLPSIADPAIAQISEERLKPLVPFGEQVGAYAPAAIVSANGASSVAGIFIDRDGYIRLAIPADIAVNANARIYFSLSYVTS